MSNVFYDAALNAVPDTLIRSARHNNEFASVEAGFDAVQTLTNAAIKAPNGESPGRLPAAAARANKSFVFDASGDPAVAVAATSAEMTAAIAAATAAGLSETAAAASAATVAGSTNALHMLQLQSGVL